MHHDTVIQYHQMRFRASPLHAVLPLCMVGCVGATFLLWRSAEASPEAMLATVAVVVCVIGMALCYHRLRRGAVWFVVDAEPGPHGGRRTHEEVRHGMGRWAAATWSLTIVVTGMLVLQFLLAMLDAGLPGSWKLFQGVMAALGSVSLILLLDRRRVNLAEEIVKGMTDPRIQRATHDA